MLLACLLCFRVPCSAASQRPPAPVVQRSRCTGGRRPHSATCKAPARLFLTPARCKVQCTANAAVVWQPWRGLGLPARPAVRSCSRGRLRAPQARAAPGAQAVDPIIAASGGEPLLTPTVKLAVALLLLLLCFLCFVQSARLFSHVVRAPARACERGSHGQPLCAGQRLFSQMVRAAAAGREDGSLAWCPLHGAA